MRHTAMATLAFWAIAGVAWAQQAPPSPLPAPMPANSEKAAEAESAPAKETFDARVHRLLDEFNQRHADRVQEMASYEKTGDSDPDLKQFADPRKVQVELKDEEDREQTSKTLAKEYTGEARQVQAQEKALEAFIARRRKTLDDLSKPAGADNQQDLEVAIENLARQPGTEAQVSELRRRLADDERNAQVQSTEQSFAQQEAARSEEELKRLRTVRETLESESKAYTADAASAHQNKLDLADRLEFYVVNAQAEDALEEGRKATVAVQHLKASPEVAGTLEGLGPGAKTENPAAAKDCTVHTGDVKGCPETTSSNSKE